MNDLQKQLSATTADSDPCGCKDNDPATMSSSADEQGPDLSQLEAALDLLSEETPDAEDELAFGGLEIDSTLEDELALAGLTATPDLPLTEIITLVQKYPGLRITFSG